MLIFVPEPGAAVPRLAIDGEAAMNAGPTSNGSPIRRTLRRRAEIVIPGWGRAEIARGSDARSLDEIEAELRETDRLFAEGLAPFGVAAVDPTALDQLRSLAGEKMARDPEMKRKQDEIDRFAPGGLEVLRHEIAQREKRRQAKESELALQARRADLPTDTAELELLADRLRKDVAANERDVNDRREENREIEIRINGHPEAGASAGLRQRENAAKERLARFNATATVLRDERNRMAAAEQIESAVRDAHEALDQARREFESAKLTESEETIRDAP